MCPEAAAEISGACVAYALLLPLAMLAGLLLAAAAAAWAVRGWMKRRDKAWRIERRDVVFDSPPKILGATARVLAGTRAWVSTRRRCGRRADVRVRERGELAADSALARARVMANARSWDRSGEGWH